MFAEKNVLLSVVIPVFQRQAPAERAIRSVLEQRVDCEIIIVDDCSPEPFKLPADIAGPSVQLVRHETNRGAAAARNTGMARASGSWLTFLDSDDALLPDTLEKRLRFAQDHAAKHPDSLAVYGAAFLNVDENGKPVRVRTPLSGRNASDFASGCWFCPGSCILLRRQPFLDRVGWQTESLRRLEDLDWFLRAGLAGAELVVDRTVAAAITRSIPPTAAALAETVSKVVHLWEGSALSTKERRRLKAYLNLELAAALRRDGNTTSAAMSLARSFLLKPRLSLHLSPGWETRAAAHHEASFA